MIPAEFQRVLPLVVGWIRETLTATAPSARPVLSYGFSRLPAYYTPDRLTQTKVTEVDRVPVPPLSTFGLSQFRDFEEMDADGITYLDTYFVRREAARRESLHFHELVHAVQWQILGPERFLALYADGLEKFGYRDSPLEVMAYGLQAQFDLHPQPLDVETAVKRQLEEWGMDRGEPIF